MNYYNEPMKDKIGNLLTIKEVADKLRISERTIYRYIEAGKLKAIKLTRGITRISEEDLIHFIKKHRTR